MKITASFFAAFLKCPTKCWLRATGETPSGNTYAEWVQSQDESYRATETERLLAGTPPGESARAPAAESLKTVKWQFAVDIAVRSEFGSSRGDEAQTEKSEIGNRKSEIENQPESDVVCYH
ncbi:MAG: hypothetical protein WCH99_20320 [Verrucomicrobiota bacterium]